MKRKTTRKVKVGDINIGGDSSIKVQSMTNTDTRDIGATVEQILRLQEAGCDIVRCAVPDQKASDAIGQIVKEIDIPLVADIHFDYRLALSSI
ncbi:MAG: flavodoxin-dependent (E)-4-hydroxy-3-methylbut-2-enyl-diphosphate synthase, partial [Eubacteriales bacterium]